MKIIKFALFDFAVFAELTFPNGMTASWGMIKDGEIAAYSIIFSKKCDITGIDFKVMVSLRHYHWSLSEEMGEYIPFTEETMPSYVKNKEQQEFLITGKTPDELNFIKEVQLALQN